MSEERKTQPTHRVSFATEREDKDGKKSLGNAQEIGSIWPRKGEGREGQGILRLDVVPQDISKGVLFVRENRPRDRDDDRER